MGFRYDDYARNRNKEKDSGDHPHCFGDPDYYDSTDKQCMYLCKSRFACKKEVVENDRPAVLTMRNSPNRHTQFSPPTPKPKTHNNESFVKEGEPFSYRVRVDAIRAGGAAMLETVRRAIDPNEAGSYDFPYKPPQVILICNECKNKCEEDEKYCSSCGKKLQ